MGDLDTTFTGSIPELYDRLMVPLIFEPYAADLARRVAARAPDAVLEIAAGSGAVTRAVAPVLGPDATMTVTDLNQPMLDRARSRQGDDARLSWQQADALDLPFADATFDMVLCQFGAMFFPDRIRGYAEARRVLGPGGTFLFSAWDRIEENAFADHVTRAAATVFPDDPPVFFARTPYGYHDPDRIRSEVLAAGFPDCEIEVLTAASRAESAEVVARAYVQGTPLRSEIEARDASRLEEMTEITAAALRREFGDGPVEGRIQAFVVTAAA